MWLERANIQSCRIMYSNTLYQVSLWRSLQVPPATWGAEEVASVFSQPPIRKTGVSRQKPPCPLAVPAGTELSGFCLREEKAGP